MTNYTMRRLRRKRSRFAERQPDLFDWRPPAPLPLAAAVLARRCALPPHIARVVADLAGFRPEHLS
jgi:hypothetical protein